MRESRSYSATPLKVFALVLIAIGIVPVANLLSAGQAVPWWSAAVSEWCTTGLAIILLAVLAAVVADTRLTAVMERARAALLSPSPLSFEIGAAVVVTILAAIFSWYCFSGLV